MVSHRHRVHEIIEEYTKHNVVLIPHDIVSEFKSLLRGNNILIEFCFGALFEKLSNNHAQTRLLALCLINCIFQRSKRFRELTVDHLEVLFDLTLPINPHKPLPAPRKTAKYLSEQSIEFIEEWTQDFCARYFRLKLGYQHLTNVHHIRFPNKRLHEQQQQKLKQIKHIKQIKEKLQRLVELTDKFKQKYPKILNFLLKFETKIEEITPSFDGILQKVSQKQKQKRFIGFSDDEESESERESEDQNSDDDDLNLQLPSFSNISCNDANGVVEDEFMNELDFMSNCHRYGLQKGYSLKITISTDIDSYLKSKQQKNENVKNLLKQVRTYRYLTETKLIHQIEEWRTILINADLTVITNTNKQLLLANSRMDILRKLDQIHTRINGIIARCDALKIVAKNKQKRKKKKDKKAKKVKRKLAATYVDVGASLSFLNQTGIQIHRVKSIRNKQQRDRILFKKLLPGRKNSTTAKFGLGSKFPDK